MSKKIIVTLRKSPRLVEGTSMDEVHAPTFNILTQTPPSKNVENSGKDDCGLYTCPFAKYISNGVFDMCSVDIDAKYHRQRYATIIWHYRKTKNEDGAISESEVTGTVASKFGGPRLAKEHAPDTNNYLTPRPQKRNLR
ncbi:hypothetical protein H5410_055632 [Solanum commersonii]|uniref:Uncharacterized protein n=1 Tax=Solanum commersonii TaxID=4109 RepID=A0A9J5WIV6_SOLCO|nr:hypothetical protein H5410_055632 [Solanum commersonii]